MHNGASGVGVRWRFGQVIVKQERVVLFISRSLQDAELKWCPREKEALAIVLACESFRPNVYHRPPLSSMAYEVYVPRTD
jgi:hypothetical protein